MSPDLLLLIAKATLDTLRMVAIAGLVGSLIGLPIGIFLATSGRANSFPHPISTGPWGWW